MGWDWFGTATTALVGIAGIAAATLISARERRHQRDQDLINEKRRAYANIFASTDRIISAIKRVRLLRERQADMATSDEAVARLRQARFDYNTAMYELALSSPTPVLLIANELRLAVRSRADRAEDGVEEDYSVRDIRGRLLNAMRADLGYPVLPDDALR